jgi:hypothetical protein
MERSEDGTLKFANYRSGDCVADARGTGPEIKDPIALPPDPALKADLAAYKWKMTKGGVQVRSKDEMKTELGRSPDDGDAVVYANIVVMKEEQYEELVRETRGGFDRYAEDLPDYQPMGKAYDRYAE